MAIVFGVGCGWLAGLGFFLFDRFRERRFLNQMHRNSERLKKVLNVG